MKLTPLIFAAFLTLPVLAQNVGRAVPTSAELVSSDPRTFANNPLNGGSSFEAVVLTTGDSIAGSGSKVWRWDAASAAATNTATANGPIAWPYGAATGRWVLLSTAKDASQDATIGALGGYVTPEGYGAAGNGSTDDTTAIQAALTAAASSDNQTCLFQKTYRMNQTGVVVPDNVTLLFVGDARVEPTAHPQSTFEAAEVYGRLFQLGDNNRVIGAGRKHFDGRRDDAAYNATIPAGTWRKFACFRVTGGTTNVLIQDFVFEDYYDAPIYCRDADRVTVKNCGFIKGAQAIRCYRTPNITFSENMIHGLEMTQTGIGSAVTVFQDCPSLRVERNTVERILASTGTTVSAVNAFSCAGAIVSGNWFGALQPGSSLTYTTIAFDGSEGGLVENNTFYQFNHAGVAIGMEGCRSYVCRGNTVIPPVGANWTGIEPGNWIYTRSAEIHGSGKPGGFVPNDPGLQERSLSATYRGIIEGNFLMRGGIGIYINGSSILVKDNWCIGQTTQGIRVEGHVNGATTDDDFSINNITHRHREISIIGNTVKNCKSSGMQFADGKEVLVEGNIFSNNDQNDSGTHAFTIAAQATGTISTGSSSTTIEVSGTLTANSLGGRHLWLPDTRQIAEIEDNTTGEIILRGAGVTTPPSNGHAYAVVRGHLDAMIFRNNRIYDNQLGHARTNVVSLNPTQTYTSAALFALSTTDGELFEPGRRIILKGVLSGNVDATVEVVGADMDYADTYWVLPVTPTSGTFATTAGTAVRNGIGTLSHTASGPANQAVTQTQLTGSGTDLDAWGQVWNNGWIQVNGDWIRIRQVTSSTAMYALEKPAANFSGQSFLVSLVNVEGYQTQGRAYSVSHSPVRMAMSGNVMYGNEGSSGIASPQGYVDFATAPNFIPRITGNSTTPTVDLQFPVMRFDYSAPTTITDLRNAFHGAEITLYPDPESDVTLGFASGGTKLRGNGGVNETLAPGEVAHCRYIHDGAQDGFWYVTIIK